MYHDALSESTVLMPLMETLSDAVVFLDASGIIQYANARAAALVGREKQELSGETFWQCAPKLVTATLYQAVSTVMRTQSSLRIEYRSPVTQTLLRAHLASTCEGVAIFFSEDPDPQQNQKPLQQSNPWYQDTLENVSEHVAILTPEGILLEINMHTLTEALVKREDVIGKPFTQFPLWASVPAVQEELRTAIGQAGRGGIAYFEAAIREQEDRDINLAVTLVAHYDGNRQIEYLICVCRDVTERAQVEEVLWTLVDAIPHFVWIAQPDGAIIYSNKRLRDYTRLTQQQARGNGWHDLIPTADRQRVMEVWQAAIRTGTPYEVEHLVRDGSSGEYRWFLARGAPCFQKGQGIRYWVGTCTDIDDQKRTEKALRQSRDRERALMESNIIGIATAERDIILEANDAFLHMVGYSRDDLERRKINWFQMTPPEYIEATRQAHQELALYQYMTPCEKEYLDKNGNRVSVLVGGVTTQVEPFQAIYFVLDNSARKELEKRKDDFLNMAGHELRTPLAVVKMRIQLARRHLKRQGHDALVANLMKVEVPIAQIERLIEELLDVSRIQAGRLEYVCETFDMNVLLHELVETTQQMYSTHTIVMNDVGPLLLEGDKGRLEQVFINLLNNAIKYSPAASTVEVACESFPEFVTVSIRDHGVGIAREEQKKIFERFYRALDLGRRTVAGLGMGLYIAEEIVKQHGGKIMVESKVGEGSTFHVKLPRHC